MKVLAELSKFAESPCQRDATDVLATIKQYLEEVLPFTWSMFASDVSDAFDFRGVFPHKTAEARHYMFVFVYAYLSLRLQFH